MKMNELKALYAGILAATISTGAAAGTVTSDGPDVVIKTHSGFEAATADGNFRFQLGGRLMWDMDSADGIYNQLDNGKDSGNMEFRRARIELKGTAYKDWHYELGIDLFDGSDQENAGAGNTIDQAYIKYTGFEPAWISAGRSKTPFGLEEITSSKRISTIERSIISDFHPAAGKQQNIAVGGDLADMFTWHAALVDQEATDGTDGTKTFGYGGRVTFSPVHDDGKVLHFGLAYYDANPDVNDGARDTIFRTRMGVHTAEDGGAFRPRLRTDGTTPHALDKDETVGLEAAFVTGPFSLQGEYFQRDMRVANVATGASVVDPEAEGYYLQGTWTLTGESRSYKWKDGKFDRVKPGGRNGAWELVGRWESVELDTDVATASELEFELLTLGLNWYVNRNVTMKLNYLDAQVDGLDAANQAVIAANAAYGGNGGFDTVAGLAAGGANADEDGRAVTMRLQYDF